jgi:anti-sigma factor RsiW
VPVDTNPGQEHDANLLAAFLEDRLSPPERRAVEGHLADCRDCRQTLATWGMANAQPARRPSLKLPAWLGAAAALALAGWFGYQVVSVEHRSVSPAPPKTPEVAHSKIESAQPAAPTSERASSVPSPDVRPRAEEPLTTRRGGERRLGSKTFRFVAGEWIDSSFDPIAGLPIVEARGRKERRAAVARVPELAPYVRLGDHVTVVVGGTVYRFLPPSP